MTLTTELPTQRGRSGRAPRTARDRRRESLLFRRYCTTRDPSLREELVRTYLPLARTIARRYQSPRVPIEDLMQVAAIGLMKAIDRYEPGRGVAFSSYAVPTMMGEVQRHFRDHTWGVRPPRELQERAQRLITVNREMSAQLGRPPTAGELAARLQLVARAGRRRAPGVRGARRHVAGPPAHRRRGRRHVRRHDGRHRPRVRAGREGRHGRAPDGPARPSASVRSCGCASRRTSRSPRSASAWAAARCTSRGSCAARWRSSRPPPASDQTSSELEVSGRVR